MTYNTKIITFELLGRCDLKESKSWLVNSKKKGGYDCKASFRPKKFKHDGTISPCCKKGIDVCFVSRNFHQKGVKGCFHKTRSLQHNRLRTSTQLVGTYIIYYTKRWKIIINCIQILLAITYQKMCKIILKFKIPWWNNCCSCA